MDGTEMVIAAAAAFVGTHFLLSHPLRAPVVGIIGEGGFTIVYSIIALGTLSWAVAQWRRRGRALWVPRHAPQ